MSLNMTDDWKLKTSPVVELKIPNKRFVCRLDFKGSL